MIITIITIITKQKIIAIIQGHCHSAIGDPKYYLL